MGADDDRRDRRARTAARDPLLPVVLTPAAMEQHRGEAPRPAAGVRGRAAFRYNATAYVGVNALLVGTWAITGAGFFWPFFPAAGWGIGLALQALAVFGRSDPAGPAPAVTAVTVGPPALGGAGSATRFVAVLFTDIVGSTSLTESLGDQRWSVLRAEHRALLHRCFERDGGTEVSAQGDGFLARFDHPAAAVACAVAFQRALADEREATGFAPDVRIGVHCGEVVHADGDLLGHVVNVAARVTTAAAPGEILVTEPVADHLDAAVVVEDRGVQVLRGVARPRHLLAVRW